MQPLSLRILRDRGRWGRSGEKKIPRKVTTLLRFATATPRLLSPLFFLLKFGSIPLGSPIAFFFFYSFNADILPLWFMLIHIIYISRIYLRRSSKNAVSKRACTFSPEQKKKKKIKNIVSVPHGTPPIFKSDYAYGFDWIIPTQHCYIPTTIY